MSMQQVQNISEKKVSLVTGASSGIGQAVALLLAKVGDQVVFTYRDERRAQETARMIAQIGGCCDPRCCEIADTSATRKLVSEVVAQYSRIDRFIHCAGISNTKTLYEIDEEEWDRMLNANLRGAFFLTKEVFACMEQQKSGRIVIVTSIAGQRGGKFSGIHYSVSKGGLETMMKCFALNGAEHGITVNAVSPGVADTPMSREEGIGTADIPLGRAAEPEEVAEAIFFLASDKAAYITGTTLDVNGGQMMR